VVILFGVCHRQTEIHGRQQREDKGLNHGYENPEAQENTGNQIRQHVRENAEHHVIPAQVRHEAQLQGEGAEKDTDEFKQENQGRDGRRGTLAG